jgi:iron complex transport system substrate-binding protein
MGAEKRVAAFLLAAVLAVTVLVRAGQTRSQAAVVDSLGRQVVFPAAVRRIISLEPEVTRIIVALGAGERLVGIDFFLRNYDFLFPLIFPDSGRLPVVSNQGQELNYEQAISLRPDLVFASPSEFRMTDAIASKLRVPVVALASMGRFQDFLGEIGTLGRILGLEGRAVRLTAYFQDRLKTFGQLAPAKDAGDRPSVYLSFWGSLTRTPVSYEPVEVAGGRNAARGLLPDYFGAAATSVSLEKIILWDPDVILVQGNYPPAERQVTVEGILRDPRLAAVKAVRTGRVHYTFGFWYWWDPALVLIETLYLSHILRPEAVPWPDLVREGNAIFKEFYGVEGVFDALDRVLACHEWTTR